MTLLFLHGAGCTGDVFDAQLEHFRGSHAPNLPGHCCAGSAQSIAQFADAVERYAGEHGLCDVTVCGHSMGAAIALELLLRSPVWLAAGILVGGGARMRVAPAFLEGLREDFEATSRRIAGYFFAEPSPERVEAAVERMRAVGQAQTLMDFEACNAFDTTERLPSVRRPVLAITGAADQLTPAKFVHVLTDRIPGAQARIVERAGHFVMAEQPAETNAAIGAFLSGLS